MGQPIAVRTDFTAVEVRRLARRAKDSDQVRRLLAIAAVLDGASRTEAAKVGGMDRQTLRDWVIRFNEQGPDGLINVPAPGAPAKLNKAHRDLPGFQRAQTMNTRPICCTWCELAGNRGGLSVYGAGAGGRDCPQEALLSMDVSYGASGLA